MSLIDISEPFRFHIESSARRLDHSPRGSKEMLEKVGAIEASLELT